jgi:hypothetical protein
MPGAQVRQEHPVHLPRLALDADLRPAGSVQPPSPRQGPLQRPVQRLERAGAVHRREPTATARAYLQFARGFRLELIDGWFTQENYWSRDIGAGSATVRFPLDKGGYWERLIDRPERFGKQKARFKPGESYKGVWWCPPSLPLVDVDELYIVEGIFDAIALLHHDTPAVSMMSSAPSPRNRSAPSRRLPGSGQAPAAPGLGAG